MSRMDTKLVNDITLAKFEVLRLAQVLAPDEPMQAFDAQRSLRETVALIAATPSTTPLQMALIALALAERLDNPGAMR